MAGEFVLVFLWQSFRLNYIRNKNNLPSVKLAAPEGSPPCRGRRARVPRKPIEPAGASSPGRATQTGQVEG